MFNTFTQKSIACALVLATLITVDTATAQPGGEDGKRRGPPAEAIEACSDKSEGATCGFSGRRGEALEGTCFAPPGDGNELACKPEGGRGGQPQNSGERE